MVSFCQKQGLQEPEYLVDNNGVHITFWKSTATIQKTIQKDPETIQRAIQKSLEMRGITVTDFQMNILVFFCLHPEATRKNYIASGKDISEGGTISNISRLQELGLLRREGGRKDGRWVVIVDGLN